MPELPEVEILVRHLRERLQGRRIRKVQILRQRVVRFERGQSFAERLIKCRIEDVSRRAKFLVFQLSLRQSSRRLIGHLGMTGRMYVLSGKARLPPHAAVVLKLDRGRFVFEDIRQFGRLTLNPACLENLGPEPLTEDFDPESFFQGLQRSRRAIKPRLLQQDLVAGLGNIHLCEALFSAGIDPRTPAQDLSRKRVAKLWESIRRTLNRAIELGDNLALNLGGSGNADRLFYFGRQPGETTVSDERFLVYDRQGETCTVCREPIRRIVLFARSTFFCPRCQT